MIEIRSAHPYRQVRFLYLALVFCLIGWAVSSTLFGLQKKPKEMPLIIIEDFVPRVLKEEDEVALKNEKIKFIKRFLSRYYTYDAETFESQVGDAADMMRLDFWLKSKAAILNVEAKLKAEPFSQKSSIETITEDDRVGFNASLITVFSDRLKNARFRTRVHVDVAMKPRTDTNPWRYEVTYVSEKIEPL